MSEVTGPDLTRGVAESEVDRVLLGHAGDEPVLLVRSGDELFAVGASCSHYGGPLAEGTIEGHEVRCPWHHARFDLRTGEVVAPPALNPIPCWKVERRDGLVILGAKCPPVSSKPHASALRSIAIIGAGAAGNAAAEQLRRSGCDGALVMISAEEPVDRPNLSKDYLAGTAQEEWIPLRDRGFYEAQKITLEIGSRASAIDPRAKEIVLASGKKIAWDRALLATGATPNRLAIPGADLPHVFYLRSLADSRAIVGRSASARRAVVIGTSFIGLEVAASLRARKLEVHVVGPDAKPLARVLGQELGDMVRDLHVRHGVRFHLQRKPAEIDARAVTLDDGTRIEADLVVAGIGVRPATELAEAAGCAIDRGVLVDAFLETTVPGIFAAGDLARWPDPHGEGTLRVEHWVVAERQGETAARNMLGARETYRAVPFFWSQHYDHAIRYVGHAESWDRIDIAGNVDEYDAAVFYRSADRIVAVATIGRDRTNLEAEAALERDDQRALEAILRA